MLTLTDRDKRIFHTMAKCGGMTAAQVSTLFFPPAAVVHSNCQYRLKKLREAGYIRRIERYQLLSEGKKAYLYAITRKGARVLAGWLGCELEDLDWRQTDVRLHAEYVEHLILTTDVYVAIAKAAQSTPGLSLKVWTDEVALKRIHSADKMKIIGPQGTTQTAILVPDAYFVLQIQGQAEKHFFLEIDRATETGFSSDESRRTWTRKIRAYLEYYKRDGFYQQRYGTRKGRVLTVTTSNVRLANLKRLTEEAGGRQRFWFTSFQQVLPSTILDTPIWELAQAERMHTLLGGDEE